MKVVDIFDGNQNLIERIDVTELGFDPKVNVKDMLEYAQQTVYENAYNNWMKNKNLEPNEYYRYYEQASYYAAKEANYAGWKIKDVEDHI